jgi:antitoxin component of MazEF toxin-antitoxin module
MSEEQKTFEDKVEDIFEDIPGDSQNVNFTIPPEIMEAQGWKEGDNLKISWGDQGTVIIEKVEEAPEST